MTCLRHPDDRNLGLVRDKHLPTCTDTNDDDCRGCQPCDHRHCTRCRTHLDTAVIQTCDDCRAKARRDLHAIVDLAALLPFHALHAAHDAHLAASGTIPGEDALVMMSRGSEGLSDDNDTAHADEPLPPSYVLGWWEETWRDRLGLDSRRPAWQRRPAATLVGAHAFLNQHLSWAATHHPGFHTFARDLHATRGHLEELLRAGEAPALGVPCFECGAILERDFRDSKPCRCHIAGYRRHHHQDNVCCLACAWEEIHAACDQGGLTDTDPFAGWHCPRCQRRYSPGEYQLALHARHDDVAEYRRLEDAARLTGAKPGTIKVWATRDLVRRRRDDSGRVTYNLPDIRTRLTTDHDTQVFA